jgi:DMSO/TMAO reductase YedYZ molybdopterin-dependent catalytic subunit
LADSSPLPAGQRALPSFPRFGVVAFAKRRLRSRDVSLEISGALERTIVLTATDLAALPRVTLTADFHCAATWSHRSVEWSGYRFKDVFEMLIAPNTSHRGEIGFVILRCQDGYRTSLPLADLLAPDVLIADRLGDLPLTVEHGAPVRLVAPAHYGYKSAKHLDRIELRANGRGYRTILPRFMEHPRARVAFEERGQFLPGWLLRLLFRPFVRPIIRKIESLSSEQEQQGK